MTEKSGEKEEKSLFKHCTQQYGMVKFCSEKGQQTNLAPDKAAINIYWWQHCNQSSPALIITKMMMVVMTYLSIPAKKTSSSIRVAV